MNSYLEILARCPRLEMISAIALITYATTKGCANRRQRFP